MGSGKHGMRAAALFQFGSKYVSMGAQVVIAMFFASLIAPEDFGRAVSERCFCHG